MRRFSTRLVALLFVLVLSSAVLWRMRFTTPETSTQILAPGLTLTTIQANRLAGAVQMRVVRADFHAGWRLKVVPAAGSVVQREMVDSMARRTKAIIAVNGGFFAYDGAAVGPLVIDGHWIRLPWKNRTAIGFGADGKAKIDTLKARAIISLSNGVTLPLGNLNGTPPQNGFTVLTSDYGNSYELASDESALSAKSNAVSGRQNTGTVAIIPNDFILVAKGDARSQLDGISVGTSTAMKVEVDPAQWGKYPTILGAGPRLIKNGVVRTTEVQEEFKPDVIARGPRTAIGIDKDGNWILVVVTGWQPNFQGITIPEFGQEMADLGAVDALNLDGGGSIAMAVNGKTVVKSSDFVNNPVANAVIVTNEAN